MRGTVLGQQHAGQGGSGPRLPVAPRREARVTCPAAPAAAPHRRARQGLSAGRSVVLPPWPPPGEGGLSVTPSISSAFVLVRIRCCRRSSLASNRNGLISCSTRARVLVALLEGPPSPRQISYYKNQTDDVLSRSLFKKVDGREGLLYDDFHFVVAVVRRHRCIHHNGLRDRIATRSCRS